MDFIDDKISCRGINILCPFVNSTNNSVYYVSQGSGEIFLCERGEFKVVARTDGEPRGAVFDNNGQLFVADCGNAVILKIDDKKVNIVVKAYEEKTFQGPHSIAFDPSGTMYFTDSGPFGETNLQNPKGSLYCVSTSGGGKVLRPIALESLAYPTGVAVSPDGEKLFVAEMMKNRILRYVQRPAGVYHGSVFCRLSGGIGPSCIACDDSGRLFVGMYDIAGPKQDGIVYVINYAGVIEHRFHVPGSEISGISIRDNRTLYITETSTDSMYVISLDNIFGD